MTTFINMNLTNKYIHLLKLQRPYIPGTTNEDIFDAYMQDVKQDYNDIKDYIVNSIQIVDLGAGVGGIDYLIKTFNPNVSVTLLDGTGVVEGEHYGYRDNIAFYSDNQVAQDFFKSNNVTVDFLPADPTVIVKCDTLISLNSWGFHYPLEHYRVFLENNSETINTIIIDTRIKYQNTAILEEFGFVHCKALRRWGSKKQRMLFSKQPIAACEPNNVLIAGLRNSSDTGPACESTAPDQA